MIQKGSKVSIHYTLKVEGEIVDTTDGQEPFSFEHGAGELIVGFEENLKGLKNGEKKNFSVNSENGYGEHNPEAVEKIPLNSFDDHKDLKVGEVVSGNIGEHPFQATVVAIDDELVTLDLNHPLAGKTLEFEVEVLSVE